MTTYTFTCPLTGCGQIMTNHAVDTDAAAHDLISKAKEHLKEVHPDVQKTDQEIDADIRSHMVTIES